MKRAVLFVLLLVMMFGGLGGLQGLRGQALQGVWAEDDDSIEWSQRRPGSYQIWEARDVTVTFFIALLGGLFRMQLNEGVGTDVFGWPNSVGTAISTPNKQPRDMVINIDIWSAVVSLGFGGYTTGGTAYCYWNTEWGRWEDAVTKMTMYYANEIRLEDDDNLTIVEILCDNKVLWWGKWFLTSWGALDEDKEVWIDQVVADSFDWSPNGRYGSMTFWEAFRTYQNDVTQSYYNPERNGIETILRVNNGLIWNEHYTYTLPEGMTNATKLCELPKPWLDLTLEGYRAGHCGRKTTRINLVGLGVDANWMSFPESAAGPIIYDGSAHTPVPRIATPGGYALHPGSEYTIAYEDNINAGTATAKVRGQGRFSTAGYSGSDSAEVHFTIAPRPLKSNALLTASVIYNGGTPIPALALQDDLGNALTPGRDYTVMSYPKSATRVNAGDTVNITVNATGNYTGEISTQAVIARKALGLGWIGMNASDTAVTYDGKAHTPIVAVTDMDRSVTLVDNSDASIRADYTLAYSNNINAGTAVVTATGEGNYTGTATRTFTIRPKTLREGWLRQGNVQMYDAGGVEDGIVVADEDLSKVLEVGKDYTVVYQQNDGVGENRAQVTVTGRGNYTGTLTGTFTILSRPLDADSIWYDGQQTAGTVGSRTYSGVAYEPTVDIVKAKRDDGTWGRLTAGEDYVVNYGDNVSAGNASIIVSGVGNYAGSVVQRFVIAPKALEAGWLRLKDEGFVYSGQVISLQGAVEVVTDEGQLLTIGEDYVADVSDNVSAGSATLTISGRGNYGGVVTRTFVIGAKSLLASWVRFDVGPYVANGQAICPAVSVTDPDKGKLLEAGTDYIVDYADNVYPGQAMVIVSGRGNYGGVATLYFTISGSPFPDNAIQPIDTCIYSGLAITPTVVVKDGGRTLTEGNDYVIAGYSDNVAAGTARVNIAGRGAYAGLTSTATFVIAPKPLKDGWLWSIGEQEWSGEPVKPPVVVIDADNGQTLTPAVDYTYAYSDNIDAGIAKVRVSGAGNYGGVIEGTFVILPASDDNDSADNDTDSVDTGANDSIGSDPSDNEHTPSEGGKTGEGNTSVEPATATPSALRTLAVENGLLISGLTPGENFGLYTLQGQLLYQAVAPADGEVVLPLRNQGVYIIRQGLRVQKFCR